MTRQTCGLPLRREEKAELKWWQGLVFWMVIMIVANAVSLLIWPEGDFSLARWLWVPASTGVVAYGLLLAWERFGAKRE